VARPIGLAFVSLCAAVACRSAAPAEPQRGGAFFLGRCGPDQPTVHDRRGVEMLCHSGRVVAAQIFGDDVCGREGSVSIEWQPEPGEVAFELEELSFDRMGDPAWSRALDEKLAEPTWKNASRFVLRGVTRSPLRQLEAGAVWRWRPALADGSRGPWLYAEWSCSLI
jgi:hypothetical protein